MYFVPIFVSVRDRMSYFTTTKVLSLTKTSSKIIQTKEIVARKQAFYDLVRFRCCRFGVVSKFDFFEPQILQSSRTRTELNGNMSNSNFTTTYVSRYIGQLFYFPLNKTKIKTEKSGSVPIFVSVLDRMSYFTLLKFKFDYEIK